MRLTHVTCGGAPVYVWPGGGITFMVDVTRLPDNAFGYVPTPALVAPIEFTMRRDDYAALGGHMDAVVRDARELRAIGNKRDDAACGQSLAARPQGAARDRTPVGGSPTGGCISSTGRSISSSRRMAERDSVSRRL